MPHYMQQRHHSVDFEKRQRLQDPRYFELPGCHTPPRQAEHQGGSQLAAFD